MCVNSALALYEYDIIFKFMSLFVLCPTHYSAFPRELYFCINKNEELHLHCTVQFNNEVVPKKLEKKSFNVLATKEKKPFQYLSKGTVQ
jgi:hypothetical protein